MNIKTPVSEKIFRLLRKQIISLDLKPYQVIKEERFAKLLSVSRTPLREAFLKLALEGLIDMNSGSSIIVAPIDEEKVKTAQYVREKLELEIIKEAALSDNSLIMLKIKQAIEEQEHAISNKDYSNFFYADEKMHLLISKLAGKRSVWEFIVLAKHHMDRLRRVALMETPFEDLYQDHILIFEAIKDNNPALASDRMKVHLRRVMVALPELKEKFPNYFTKEDPINLKIPCESEVEYE